MSGGRKGPVPTFDVFVGNLPEDTEEAQIRALFKKFGDIQSVSCFEGKRKDGSKIAFVRYLSESEAETATKEGYGMVINEHSITTSKCNPRNKGGGGGGGGGPANDLSNKPDVVQSNRMKNPGLNKKMGGGGGGHGPIAGHGAANKCAEVVKTEPITVTHIETPLKFWAQNAEVERLTELQNMTDSLQIVCPSAPVLTSKPLPTKIYASRFTEDGLWYRCTMTKEMSETEVYVQYVDYGNGEMKNISEIVELPASLNSPRAHAKLFCLFGLKPVCHDPESMGFTQGVAHLTTLTDSKVLNAQHISVGVKQPMTPVILLDPEKSDLDINQEMLDKKFGEKRAKPLSPLAGSAGSMASKGKTLQQRVQEAKYSTEAPVVWGGGDMANKSNLRAGLPNLDQTSMSWVNASGVPTASVDTGIPSLMPMPNHNEDKLRAEVQGLRSEIMHLKTQHTMDVNRIKTEHASSSMEYASLQANFKAMKEEYDMMVKKVDDANFKMKVTNLVASVNKVKMLRQQFPTGEQACDLIEKAIILTLKEEERIDIQNMEIITNVKSSLDTYKFLQNRIRIATELAQVEELLPARDGARVQLHTRLADFVVAVDKIPLQSRREQLQACVDDLERTYPTYLQNDVHSSLSIPEIAQIYTDWKEEKLCEFAEFRTATNTCHNSVNSVVKSLQTQLSLSDLCSMENPHTTGTAHLDTFFEQYQSALNVEIEKTDMERTDDASRLCLVVCMLVQRLRSELTAIEVLHSLSCEYRELKEQLSPWLQEKPCLDDIKALRRDIKKLKSKLRHKLADKQDMVENEEVDSDEYKELLVEMTALRTELHEAFNKEDVFLADLADHNEKHFPELRLQHSDIGLDNVSAFSGLVKVGRSLDQYDVKEKMETGSQRSTIKTAYCGRPVLIKQDYLIDVSKEEYLRQAAAYNTVLNKNVLPLEAVFEHDRHMCLQIPSYETTLTTLVLQEPPSYEVINRVLIDILNGLDALHKQQLVHGALHPNNIFIDKNGHAVIAEFNFGKTLEQRYEKAFVSDAGLIFKAPEVSLGQQISQATDIYSFGCIAFWMHYPHAGSLSEFVKTEENAKLEQLLNYLFSPDPSKRCSAAEAAKFPFFSVSSYVRSVSPSPQDDFIQLRQPSPKPANLSGGILKNTQSPTPPDVGVCEEEVDGSNEAPAHSPPDVVPGVDEAAVDGVSEPTTPLPCTPMGTPINTPVEVEMAEQAKREESNGCPVMKLVSSAAEQAAKYVVDEVVEDVINTADDEPNEETDVRVEGDGINGGGDEEEEEEEDVNTEATPSKENREKCSAEGENESQDVPAEMNGDMPDLEENAD